MAGNADNRIAFRFRKAPLVLALDIKDADPGRKGYLCRCKVLITAPGGRCRDPGRQPAIDHEPRGERDISLVGRITLPVFPDIGRLLGVETAERLAADRGIGLLFFDSNRCRDGCLPGLGGRDIEVRAETVDLEMVRLSLTIAPEDVDERRPVSRVLYLVYADT